ncbi:MAG TPA: DUF2934 domain-containing protein [Candidatus Binatia bacterium]|nr:DUF2934 domain-containing protein [Candidatus Binatia bacterium]
MAEPRTRAATSRSQRPRISDQELYERVAHKAYELYQQRGEAPGDDLADWLLAERLVQEELLHGPVPEEPLSDDEAE